MHLQYISLTVLPSYRSNGQKQFPSLLHFPKQLLLQSPLQLNAIYTLFLGLTINFITHPSYFNGQKQLFNEPHFAMQFPVQRPPQPAAILNIFFGLIINFIKLPPIF